MQIECSEEAWEIKMTLMFSRAIAVNKRMEKQQVEPDKRGETKNKPNSVLYWTPGKLITGKGTGANLVWKSF
mgnify:CR=1 FL=1